MPIFALGISHHTAPLEVRERLAIPRGDYADKVLELQSSLGASEAVIVSTCNRTELYGVAGSDQGQAMGQWLLDQGGISDHESADLLYVHEGQDAVHHLFCVACGLDSMVLGEPQIIGQLKKAWQVSKRAGGAGRFLDRLFQRAFSVSKEVRTHTGINDHPVSVAYITAILAQQIFGDLTHKTVLLVGAGEMMALCGQHFRQQRVGKLLIANRSPQRAEQLGDMLDAETMDLEAMKDRLGEADIIITSTSAPQAVIQAQEVSAAVKARKRDPMFLVDLGVPRDIEPATASLRDVYLYTIDDLRQVADESQDRRQAAAHEALVTIDREVQTYQRWLNGARATDSLKQLRGHAEASRDALTERALRQIQAGKDPAEVVKQLGKALTNRFLHGPSTRLREAAERQQDEILQAANKLFEPADRSLPEPAADPDAPDEDS